MDTTVNFLNNEDTFVFEKEENTAETGYSSRESSSNGFVETTRKQIYRKLNSSTCTPKVTKGKIVYFALGILCCYLVMNMMYMWPDHEKGHHHNTDTALPIPPETPKDPFASTWIYDEISEGDELNGIPTTIIIPTANPSDDNDDHGDNNDRSTASTDERGYDNEVEKLKSQTCEPKAEIWPVKSLLRPDEEVMEYDTIPRSVVVRRCSEKTGYCSEIHRCQPTKEGTVDKIMYFKVVVNTTKTTIVRRSAHNITEHVSCQCQ